MNLSFIQFREAFFQQGLFSTDHIRLQFPDFNSDNLLYWQQKGYILKLRNKWYCFKEFTGIADFHYLIANQVYHPSYISHQQALMFYGIIPEHIVDSTSITTKKTSGFEILQRHYKYYSVKPELYFGYRLMSMNVNGIVRNFLIAEKEKAILDFLYLFTFYKTQQDIEELRFNELVLENDMDWEKLNSYLLRFQSKALESKINLLKKTIGYD
jgi:predicted transcriptional regulator of viral defense system